MRAWCTLLAGLTLVGCGAGNSDQLQRLQVEQAQLSARQGRLEAALKGAQAELAKQKQLQLELQRVRSELSEQGRDLEELKTQKPSEGPLLAAIGAPGSGDPWSCAVVCLEKIDCKKDSSGGDVTWRAKRTVHRAMGTGATAGKAYIRALDACRDGATPYHSIECSGGRIVRDDATLANSCIHN